MDTEFGSRPHPTATILLVVFCGQDINMSKNNINSAHLHIPDWGQCLSMTLPTMSVRATHTHENRDKEKYDTDIRHIEIQKKTNLTRKILKD